ncbi:PTS sugar transporter subunit IIB [Pectobacterium punjabense]|uniref:PTS sugar transporter subunit IIB n=1 Tax=Pectobacterium punjabense TaxID=2108399 RepID=UPI0038106BFC
MKIVLACAFGMSTSIVAKKITAALSPAEAGWVIHAKNIDSLADYVRDYDVVLLGPQVRMRLNDARAVCEPLNIPVDVMNAVDYGTGNGENIIKAIYKMKGA